MTTQASGQWQNESDDNLCTESMKRAWLFKKVVYDANACSRKRHFKSAAVAQW